jgi:hypothetical protein
MQVKVNFESNMLFSATILLVFLRSLDAFRLSASAGRHGSTILREGRTPEPYEFTAAILGDLHLDPRYMNDHIEGREHIKAILAKEDPSRVCVVSLGDLGESKSVDETTQLFSGTSSCFKLTREYLDGFNAPFEVIAGNHDLEGIDEFATDEENLKSYLKAFDKPASQFKRLIGDKTLLVGLGSSVFRDAQYTSHEVFIDEPQIKWFEETVKACPASEGWRVIVFSHAPPMGSGLRVLQENHVVNGCCWLNHSHKTNRRFIEIVRENPCIKAWFSGHFHLGQDYEDSITFPQDVAGNKRGSCVFAQTAVMGRKSSRDGRQQSRLLRGTKDGLTISTINHKKNGEERLDATIKFDTTSSESIVFAHPSEDYDHAAWFSAYTPQEEDGCYVGDLTTGLIDKTQQQNIAECVCWWHMACGRVLGVHNGMLLEYDAATLAPLGLVVGKDELAGRQVAIIDSGENKRDAAFEAREQAIVLYNEDMSHVTVVQPNEDGSYWRRIVRNKVIRMKEKRREKAALSFVQEKLGAENVNKGAIRSTWGPYTSTVGTAKNTAVKIVNA